MKAIKEVTYYCKTCNVPLADKVIKFDASATPHFGDIVKTGDLICPVCFKVLNGNREYIQL